MSCLGNGSDKDQPAITDGLGLMFGLSKVRSALETREYIIFAGLVSAIDKSDHRFGSYGAGPVPERGRCVSRFSPFKNRTLEDLSQIKISVILFKRRPREKEPNGEGNSSGR